ncbi:MAG: hypothetical protein U5J83_01490 [Bryobacterales bacterium]|nr:hypothetical protein [Bryobacterales bacterium]
MQMLTRRLFFYFLLSLFRQPFSALAPNGEPIRHTLRFPDAKNHYVHVEARSRPEAKPD